MKKQIVVCSYLDCSHNIRGKCFNEQISVSKNGCGVYDVTTNKLIRHDNSDIDKQGIC